MATKIKRAKLEKSLSSNDNLAIARDENIKDATSEKKQKKLKNKMKPKAEDANDWDVDNYKTDYESEDHWELRRNFMLAYKDRFDEERLVCLAQTFVNMELLGCKYPSETMHLVAELAKEIAAGYRDVRANRLKRTFVSASDAAEQRAKGRSGTKQPDRTAQSSNRRDRICFGGGTPINLYDELRFGNLIIYLAGERSCLRNSCTSAKLKYEEREVTALNSDGLKSAEILLNDEVVGKGSGDTLKSAKMAAFKQALRLLQDNCYSIKLNATRDTIKIQKDEQGVNINVTKQSADSLEQAKQDASNKGFHIMRLMGWTGGGLGRLRQGREEPVGYLFKSNRTGLGAGKGPASLSYYRTLIKNYVSNSEEMRDIQFEPTFSKEERASFHQIASQYGLRSMSYGSGESRRLLISKKVTYNVILQEVLIHRNAKFCERYFVQVPLQKAQLFPGHVAGLELENLQE